MTATQLFAIAHGKSITPGPEQCGLCGGSCDGSIAIGSILSDSFTDWQQISGDALCESCLLTLRADSRTDQARLYSWVLTPMRALRKTKADLAELRMICLAPPPPPYCIVLADSGQRHLIYRVGFIIRGVAMTAHLPASMSPDSSR